MKKREKENILTACSIGKWVAAAVARFDAFKVSTPKVGRQAALTRLTVWWLVAAFLIQSWAAPVALAFPREHGSSGFAGWRAAIPPLADAPYTMNARSYKTRLLENLSPLADSGLSGSRPGKGRDARAGQRRPLLPQSLLDAVARDVETRYIDGARLASAADARAVFRHDLQLAARLSSLLTVSNAVYNPRGKGPRRLVPDIIYAPIFSSALSDLLLAGRQSVEAIIQDAALVVGEPVNFLPAIDEEEIKTEDDSRLTAQVLAGADLSAEPEKEESSPCGENRVRKKSHSSIRGDDEAGSSMDKARRDLARAQSSFARARAAMARGLPVAALVHMDRASRRAWRALERMGIDYRADADADTDGIANQIELRLGASPLKEDTDGDGLTDAFETSQAIPFHLPGQADTDGNGIPDGKEDIDADTLTALVV